MLGRVLGLTSTTQKIVSYSGTQYSTSREAQTGDHSIRLKSSTLPLNQCASLLVISSPEPKASVRPSVVCLSIRQHFQTSLKPLGQLNSNFISRLLRTLERKLVQMVLVTWSRWPPCQNPLKNLLLQNQKSDDLGTWYVAMGMWGLPSLFKWCS